MTYIAAFRCDDGIVMCADTQETFADYKNYVEKISTIEDQSYFLAVGGAGFGDLIDAATVEIIEQVKADRPTTESELRAVIKRALAEVYDKDLKALVIGRQHTTPQLLIAAKTPGNEFCIFPTKGRRLLAKVNRAIIGYQTPYNASLLTRFHRDDLSMQQAVMLAIYLLSQSKVLDVGVGGDSRVAVITSTGVYVESPEYVKAIEPRLADYVEKLDRMFLACVDTSISAEQIKQALAKLSEEALSLHEKQLEIAYLNVLSKAPPFLDGRKLEGGGVEYPMPRGNPYSKIPAGVVMRVKKVADGE